MPGRARPRPRNQKDESRTRTRPTRRTKGRFRGSPLSFFRMHWDHEPTPNPSRRRGVNVGHACRVPLLGGVRGGSVQGELTKGRRPPWRRWIAALTGALCFGGDDRLVRSVQKLPRDDAGEEGKCGANQIWQGGIFVKQRGCEYRADDARQAARALGHANRRALFVSRR